MATAPLDTQRQALVTDHLHLVHYVVHQLAARFPRHVERGELWNAGALGLVDAAHRFDPSLGVAFPGYALVRIRGAILDATRSRDWATRSVRRGMREVHQARERLQARHGRAPTSGEVADELGISGEELDHRRADVASATLLHLDQRLGPDHDDATLGDMVEEQDAETLPGEHLERQELVGTLRTAVAGLPEAQRQVVERYYLRGEYLREIAADLGVTEARVSQIRGEALTALRALFSQTFTGVPEVAEDAPGRRRRSAYLEAMADDTSWRSRLAAGAGRADPVPVPA